MVVDLRRQGKLYQDAVDLRVVIELLHQGQERLLAGVGIQAVLEGGHAGFFGLLRFVAHVDAAGRVFADQDHGEARRDSMAGLQCGDTFGDARAQLCGKALPSMISALLMRWFPFVVS